MKTRPNEPVQEIPVPSGLPACRLLIPLRGQEPRRKRAGIPDRGRSAKMMRSLILLSLLFLCTSPAEATIWEKYPLPELVADHPVILVGEITRIDHGWRGREAIDAAHIRVQEVLKYTLEGEPPAAGTSLRLIMPSTRDETVSTADVTHDLGTRGIWFLKPSNGRYLTRHPAEVQPAKLLKRVKLLIKNTER